MESCKKQSLKKSICPARRVLNLLKGKFTLEILSEIIDGNIHYSSLLRSVEGINPRILAQRLHDFEQEGILSRKVLPTSPPQVEYKMTKKGIALRSIVEEMKKWEQTYGEETEKTIHVDCCGEVSGQYLVNELDCFVRG